MKPNLPVESSAPGGAARRVLTSLAALVALLPAGAFADAAGHAVSDQLSAEAAALAPAFVATAAAVAPAPNSGGAWGSVIAWTPHIPVTAAQLPDGRLLTFASNQRTTFPVGPEFTYAAVWDPATGQFTEINNPRHDMFCGGVSTLPDGRVVVNGGRNTTILSSVFDYRTNTWSALANMNDPRWYNTSVALIDGSVFTVAGSGGSDTGERWNSDNTWSRLTGLGWPAVYANAGYIKAWHPFVLLAPNGKLFHFGPTDTMHWVDPTGAGSIAASGQVVPGSHYPKEGAWVMYDEGRILVAGGGASPDNNPAGDGTTGTSTTLAYTVDLNGVAPVVASTAPMANARQFTNCVVLPTGAVMVIGGNTSGLKFDDTGSILTPELWNPATGTWRALADMAVPRNYHSVALLLPDGRVWSGGGGLGGNAADHRDAQIFTPPSLLNADGSAAVRPALTAAPAKIGPGVKFAVTGTAGLAKFAFIKMSALTHCVNTDLRYLTLPFAETSPGNYTLTARSNLSVMTPGYWMLFGLAANGAYSVARVIQVDATVGAQINAVADQTAITGLPTALTLGGSAPDGTVKTFAATGLPPGLALAAATGAISGTPTAPGTYRVTASLTAGTSTSASVFNWLVVPSDGIGRIKREWWLGISGATLDQLTGNAAYPNNPNGSDLLTSFETPSNWADNLGQRVRGWLVPLVTGDYQFWIASDDEGRLLLSTDETVGNARIIASVPGWSGSREWTKYPQQASVAITLQAGRRYYIEALMKEEGGGDNLAVAWQPPGATGPTVIPGNFLALVAVPNHLPTLAAPGNRTNVTGTALTLQLAASDADGNALTYSATDLPAGLALAAGSGLITGTPTATGSSNVTVSVSDGIAAPVSQSFTWTINQPLVVGLSGGASIAAGASITAAAQSTGGANPRYRWNWGDGSATTSDSSVRAASHTYAAPGRYLITLTATDDTGAILTAIYYQTVHAPLTSRRPSASVNIVFEDRATGADRIWVVNPDNDSVSVFDAGTRARLAEVAVGTAPRSLAIAPDGRVWVVNSGSATISILNSAAPAVAATVSLPRGSRPFGLAFDPTGAAGWLACEGTGKLLRLDPATGAPTGSVDVGPNVRHVSVSADGVRVFVSRFITPRLPGEATATIVTESAPSSFFGGEVVAVHAATLAIGRTVILRHSNEPDSPVSGRGIPNYLGAAVISPDGLSACVPSKQDNVKRGALRDGQSLTHDLTLRSIVSCIPLTAGVPATDDLAGRVDHDNAGIPSAAVFDSNGNYLFVALEGSREVAVIDVWSHAEIARFTASFAPQGLVLSPDNRTLFVHNFMARTVTVHNVGAIIDGASGTPALLATLPTVTNEKLSAPVLRGKQLFYDARDPRLSLQQYLSCAACHNDGGQDGRVWDFTQLGEGLRNTITLRGHGGTAQGPLHWTGNFDEVQDFEGQIRGLDGGTGLMSDADFHTATRATPLGTPKAGISTDLDALAAYVSSLTASGESPARAVAAPLPAGALAGRTVFKAQNCASCHGGAQFTISALGVFRNIGTIKPSSGQRLGAPLTGLDVPTLRGVWATAPYLHDGSAATLADAVRAHQGVTLSDAALGNLVTFLTNLDDSIAAAPVPLTVAWSAPTPTVTGAFTVTATFSSAATGFTLADLTIANGSAGNLQGSGANFSFTVTPVAAGAVTIGLAAGTVQDADGDPNLAATPLAVTFLPNSPPALTEDFSGSALDPGKWRVGSIYGALYGPDDPLLTVAQQNGQLVITPRSDFATEEYRGIVSQVTIDLRGAAVSARVTPASGGAATWLGLSGTGDNFLIFAEDGGWLYLEQIVDDVWDSVAVPFDAAQHRYWRIRHEWGTDRVLFETSPDGAAWTTLRAVARGLPINALRVELAAGTDHAESGIASAVFDDLQFLANRPPIVTNPGAQSLARGQLAGLQVQASDPEGQALTFTASGLPAGLAINAATGLISGTVSNSAVASNNVTVTANDGLRSAPVSFAWNVSALPATWSSNDLGAPAIAGRGSYASGVFTIAGAGSGLGGTSDQGQFVWQQLVGDGEFIARVPALTTANALAKAGVMFRETLQANSRFALMAVTPGANMVFEARATTGGTATQKTAPRYPAPNNWVRLVRQGNLVAGYRSSDGVAWTQVGSAVILMSPVINVGLVVTSQNVSAATTATFDNVRNLAPTLPAPWSGLDIGSPALTDLERFASGIFTVKGGGGGITGTSDSFHFVSQAWTGDGEIIARVPSQSVTDPWAKAGVMLRDTTAPNSPFAFMTVTQSYAMYFQSRGSAGAAAVAVSSPRGVAPNNWVRLVRRGNVFTAFRSSDGSAWTQVGTATFSMGTTIRIGLAVTSQNPAVISTATFDSVQVKTSSP